MVKEADVAIAVFDGASKGTKYIERIDVNDGRARAAQLAVFDESFGRRRFAGLFEFDKVNLTPRWRTDRALPT